MKSPTSGSTRSSPSQSAGGVFRSSAVVAGVLLLVALALLAALNFLGRKRGPATAPAAGVNPMTTYQAELPIVRFTDITAPAGLHFVHTNGAYGEKLLPETMGGGVAFLDFDDDGDPDLLFINSSDWPWHKRPGGKRPTPALYRNDGAGKFTDVTAGSGFDVSLYGMGVACGDYDNDGRVDVFVTAVGGNHLFRNLGSGKFVDVTTAAGVGGTGKDWSTSAAFFDYDNDGRLDLFVCNYVTWSRQIDFEANYQLPGIGRAYGPPMNFPGTFPLLYRNEGNGRFRDVSGESGVQVRRPGTGVPMAKSLGVAPVDMDGDGWIDLVVANDTIQNFVFQNQRNGTFAEIGARSGIAYDSFGQTRGAMGIDSARFRSDQALGIAIGNFANEMNALYVAKGGALMFADEAASEGFGPASQALLKFGLFFFDFDLDGRLDVLTANGHIEDEIQKVNQQQRYRQPAQLFWNRGQESGPHFVPVPPEKCGADLFQPIVGRGSAFADIDGDGDLDAVIAQINGPPLLLRNDQQLGHHWLRLKLVGVNANRDGIGAWVMVRAGGRTMAQQVMPTKGYLSQSEPVLTFGLGKSARADSVEVSWPGGAVQRLDSLPIDRLTVVRQAGGR